MVVFRVLKQMLTITGVKAQVKTVVEAGLGMAGVGVVRGAVGGRTG